MMVSLLSSIVNTGTRSVNYLLMMIHIMQEDSHRYKIVVSFHSFIKVKRFPVINLIIGDLSLYSVKENSQGSVDS